MSTDVTGSVSSPTNVETGKNELDFSEASEELRKYGDEPLPEKTPPRLSPVPRRVENVTSASNTDLSSTMEDRTVTDSSMAETTTANADGRYTEALPSDLIGALSSPSIEDNSPAAEALRANANVHVRRVDKLARKVHVQSLRKFVKRATLRGNKRGKPPRIPPQNQLGSGGIYVVDEGDEFEGDEEDIDDSLSAGITPGESSQQSNVEIIPEVEKEKDVTSLPNQEDSGEVPNEVLTGTLETGKKLLEISDPHEILQSQRWRLRRKRGGTKDGRKSYVKGKVIDGEHELYALSIAVMLGVRTSIGSTNASINPKEKRWLSSDDFMATEKYVFRPSGTTNTPPHQLGHTFKFKDYSPVAFAYLRRLFGVNEFDFLLSVCGNANFIEFISNAKSGQFFFYSRDGKFMIKTMTNAESKFLRRILPHYFRHCCQNPNTLMTKFLGMYRVKLYHLRRNVKFVIMNSVYYTDKTLQSFYDLKGSVTGRDAKPHQDVKKDNDLRRVLPTGALALNPELRERVRKQVVADCDFMRRMKIMDYSMLVGIHHIPPKRKGKLRTKSPSLKGFRFSDNRRDSFKLQDRIKGTVSALKRQGSPKLQGHASLDDSRRSESLLSGLLEKQLSNADISNIGTNKGDLRVARDDDSSVGVEKQLSLLSEYGVDDDDDNSYLEGSDKNNSNQRPVPADDTEKAELRALEMKKEETIEQVYWPFHNLFDIHGYRRMVPRRCHVCEKRGNCNCKEEVSEIPGVHVPSFVQPLSDRKDGGLEMDVTDLERPVTATIASGQEVQYDGRIFYMGIIDILQQYNARKRVEARYRRIGGAGWQDASCVHPNIYAERFIRFFDEYSQRVDEGDLMLEENEEGVHFEQHSKKPAFTDGLISGTDDMVARVSLESMGSNSSIEVSISRNEDERKEEEK